MLSFRLDGWAADNHTVLQCYLTAVNETNTRTKLEMCAEIQSENRLEACCKVYLFYNILRAQGVWINCWTLSSFSCCWNSSSPMNTVTTPEIFFHKSRFVPLREFHWAALSLARVDKWVSVSRRIIHFPVISLCASVDLRVCELFLLSSCIENTQVSYHQIHPGVWKRFFRGKLCE